MKALLLFSITSIVSACGNNGAAGTIGDPNGVVATTLTDLTETVFKSEQPAVNASVAALPVEAQALVQTAYAALEEAITKVEGMALKSLAVQDGNSLYDPDTMKKYLEDVKAQLDSLIH